MVQLQQDLGRYLELFLCLDEKLSPYSTSEDLSNLAPGTYIVSVSDAKIAVLKQRLYYNKPQLWM
jgi:hypothetical protein